MRITHNRYNILYINFNSIFIVKYAHTCIRLSVWCEDTFACRKCMYFLPKLVYLPIKSNDDSKYEVKSFQFLFDAYLSRSMRAIPLLIVSIKQLKSSKLNLVNKCIYLLI